MGKSRTLHVISTLACVLIACAGLFIITERSSKKTLNTMIEEEVDNLIKSVQNSVEAYNYSNFATIHIAATIPIIRDPNVSIKEKAEQLFGVKNADPNLVGLNITDLKGNSYLVEGPMYNFSERAYFKNALNGRKRICAHQRHRLVNHRAGKLRRFYRATQTSALACHFVQCDCARSFGRDFVLHLRKKAEISKKRVGEASRS
ncbi:MAG: hypothetical protein IJ558_05405 [Treponema sp.]|nr:hypothetical protein [Treponema sp.]